MGSMIKQQNANFKRKSRNPMNRVRNNKFFVNKSLIRLPYWICFSHIVRKSFLVFVPRKERGRKGS